MEKEKIERIQAIGSFLLGIFSPAMGVRNRAGRGQRVSKLCFFLVGDLERHQV